MKENILLTKTYAFAIRIVKLHIHLCETTKQFDIARQLLKCGTSIGANSEEAAGAESKKDFQHKISISYKEARETKFWLRIIKDVELVNNEAIQSLLVECEEILALLGRIKITTAKNLRSEIKTT